MLDLLATPATAPPFSLAGTGTTGDLDILDTLTLWTPLGVASAGPAPGTASSLLAAIKARFESEGLAADCGPLYLHRAPPRAAFPRTVVTQAGGPSRYTGTDGYVETVRVQFAVEAADAPAAEDAGRLLKAAFDPALARPKLSFADGSEMTARRGPCPLLLDPTPGPGNVAVWRQVVGYAFEVSRSMS